MLLLFCLSTATVSLWYDISTDLTSFGKVMQLSIEIKAGNQDKGCGSNLTFSFTHLMYDEDGLKRHGYQADDKIRHGQRE